MKIERLEWDSSFLKKNVGKTEVSGELSSLFVEMKEYDLVYLFSEYPLPLAPDVILNFHTKLVDEKVTYYKILEANSGKDDSVYSLPPDFAADEHFIELAIKSGEFSRFRLDPMYPDDKFRELYRIWLIQSLNHRIADEVLVFSKDGVIAGFITIKIKNGIPDIGLLAVDSAFRGKGIAGQLIHSAEHWAYFTKNKKELQVVTQGTNIAACRFYEKLGFSLKQKQYVYHCWKRN